jgi:cytochrome b
LLIIDAWTSNKFGSATPYWHKWNGYFILVLIVFRFLWGFFGGSTAVFSSFIASPPRIAAYARCLISGKAGLYLGHNPIGGLIIAVMLSLVAFQCTTGLFSSDPDHLIIEGPLAFKLSDASVDQVSRLHGLGFNLILGLSILHIAGNLFHDLFKKEGLILAMLTGRKRAAVYTDQSAAKFGSVRTALLCLGFAVLIVFGTIFALGGKLLS